MDNNQASTIKHLSSGAAIEKLKELVKHESICHFTTRLSSQPITTRPMSVQQVDDHGNFWFLSAIDSHKNREIAADHRVQLFFSNTSNYEFLTVFGQASISQDRDKINVLWNDIAKAWFEEGKEDPRITVIKVVPHEGFYWDTKDGKLVSLIKIATSAVIGKTLNEGIEGKISP
jgi:general stress protein 26